MINLLLDWLLQPLGTVFTMVIIGVLVVVVSPDKRPGLRKIGSLSIALGFLFLWIMSMPGVSNRLAFHLENRRVNPEDCTDKKQLPIVLLAGGIDKYVSSTDPYDILNRDSLLRTIKAADFYRENGRVDIYLLGDHDTDAKDTMAMSHVLTQHGVSSVQINRNNESRSTRDNAKNFVGMFDVLTKPKQIRLVTSALHIQRAAATFEKAGFRVCHVSADSLYSPAVGWVALLPYMSGLRKSTLVIREFIALVVYRARGYI
ncbi:MAG: YdcF family protein [Gammaproteobacteria bacterium]|nr:YdcF family protein [Gammaproteobacteria bacterium]